MTDNNSSDQQGSQNQQPSTTNASSTIEPYQLRELFMLIPEYDGDQILLNAFINSCDIAFSIAVDQQEFLLTVHIKNKLKGKASQLINCRNVETWRDIKQLLIVHFGDSRDLNSLIHDLQTLKQGPKESALSFINRIQSHNAKLHSSVNQQNFTAEQKQSQCTLLDSMCLDALLTGLDQKIGSIVRASNPKDLVDAAIRIKRELQLSYFETQKSPYQNRYNKPKFEPKQNTQKLSCNYCKKPGHSIDQCYKRNYNNQNKQNSNYQNNNYNQNNQNRNFQSNSTITSNTSQNNANNSNQNQRNNQPPNNNLFYKNRQHHLNSQESQETTGTSTLENQTSQPQVQENEMFQTFQTMSM